MPVRVELLLPPGDAFGDAWKEHILKSAGVKSTGSKVFLRRRSIDARGKNVRVRIAADVYESDEKVQRESFEFQFKNVSNAEPVIIIGSGPAGIFAALRLVELGFKPVIIERGKNVRERRHDLAAINKQGIVSPDSNYCFGEGGAGTYSDGKLYTRSTKRGDVNYVLQTFVHHGAWEDILIDSHPHIGTNKLPQIITSMRELILKAGGEIHFNHRLVDLVLESKKIKEIKVSDEKNHVSEIKCRSVILATGHSARDIFELLHKRKIAIEAKPFALGIRIEHPQKLIDSIQYHCRTRDPFLPAASYRLAAQLSKRGVYSFCMCPGGIIAPAMTVPGEIVVNGWSPSKRNNPYANSGIVVSVDEKDFRKFSSHKELAAMKYQQSVEQKCFEMGGENLKAPAQRMADFMEGKFSSSLPKCSYVPGITPVKMNEVLPVEIFHPLKDALKVFGREMKGYLTNEAVIVAPESRTSSPVKIPRDEKTCMHVDVEGLFPCGEGAGYAGGIVSAAMDGVRCAEAVKNYFSSTPSATRM